MVNNYTNQQIRSTTIHLQRVVIDKFIDSYVDRYNRKKTTVQNDKQQRNMRSKRIMELCHVPIHGHDFQYKVTSRLPLYWVLALLATSHPNTRKFVSPNTVHYHICTKVLQSAQRLGANLNSDTN